jgi:hypothetical protein
MQGGGGWGNDHKIMAAIHCPRTTTARKPKEREAAANINNYEGQDFAADLWPIRWDNATTMTDVPPPLLADPCPPHHGFPGSRQDDQTAGAKNIVACATAATKVVDGNEPRSEAAS